MEKDQSLFYLSEDQDRLLKNQLAEGDETAFSDFYGLYWESLYKYVISVLPDEDETADVVQETFIAFWNLRKKIKRIASLKAYLFIMARNKAFKQLKINLRKREILEKFLCFYADVDEHTEQLVNAHDLAVAIDSEIDKLPEKMRQIFILSRKENLSYNEIAERLHLSDLTVKKQINNALKYLRIRMPHDITYFVIFFSCIILAASTTLAFFKYSFS